MGLTVQNNAILMKDGSGNVRFSTDREMPHLLHVVSGSFVVGNVTGSATYVEQQHEYNSTFAFTGYSASTVTRHTAVSNNDVISGDNAFVAPFITINNGIFTTPTGQAMSALGSNVVDLYIRNDGYFAGSTVLSVEVSGGKVELVSKSEVSLSGNYTIVNHGFSHSPLSSTGSVPSNLQGTGYTVTYKIYYGRFN